MLAFITSLRHPQNSSDYDRVERLLAATLRSVTNQSSDDYVVVVVGNQAPTIPLPPRVHVVTVDFPPPAPAGGETSREAVVRDKGSKLAVGLVHAQQFHPDHVMIFDADDFVHHSIAQWCADHRDEDGWFIDRGYVLSSRRQVYREQGRFNKTCGTCMIVANRHYRVPADLKVEASQDSVIEAFGDTLWRTLGSHPTAVEWFATQGVVLAPLPFHGAVYHVDTGENHSKKTLGGLARPISASVAATFGLARQGSAARHLWAAVGPRPLAQSLKGRAWHLSSRLRQRRHGRSA